MKENADYIQDNLNQMYGFPNESPNRPAPGVDMASRLISSKLNVDMVSFTQKVRINDCKQRIK